MNVIAGKLFGSISRSGHAAPLAPPHLPECAISAARFLRDRPAGTLMQRSEA